MKKSERRFLSGIIVASFVFLMLSAFNVNAATVTSVGTKKSQTVLGISYSYYSSVYKYDNNKVIGAINVEAAKGFESGYAGVNSRLYNSSGALVTSSGWYYNEGLGYAWSMPSGSTTTKGTYYSKGQVKLYNGNGYNVYTCNSSPNVTLKSITMYEVNDIRLTYGSDYYADEEESPDLVQVIGLNGEEGYVYSKDLESDINSLEEAIEYARAEHYDYEIPVYESDGKTVIDSFKITFSERDM